MPEIQAQSRGYLLDPFRVFLLSGIPRNEVPPHYHDFHKIVLMLGGEIRYQVEQGIYTIRDGCCVTVEAGTIHRPLLNPYDTYDRLILYISPAFLDSRKGLRECFDEAVRSGPPVAELPASLRKEAEQLTDASCGESGLPSLMQESRVITFLIGLTDVLRTRDLSRSFVSISDPLARDCIEWIMPRLADPLSIPGIADALHVSPSRLMHRFQSVTGSTLMDYIREKRLFLAQRLLSEGTPAGIVWSEAGFGSYSSFYRAYTARYGVSPDPRRSHAPSSPPVQEE